MTEQAKRGPGRPRKEESVPQLPDGMVKVRILPMGDGKVSTGKGAVKDETGKIKFQRAKKGDVLTVSSDIGEKLEKRGFAEVQ